MIYQQPVRYEYQRIAPATLLIVGAEDHVVPLGNYAQADEAARLGDFIALLVHHFDLIDHRTRRFIAFKRQAK